MRKLAVFLMVVFTAASSWALSTSTFTVSTSGVSYSKATIKLTVSDTTNIATYYLYRAMGTGAFALVDSAAKDSLIHSFVQTGLRNGTSWHYYVIIKDTTGNVTKFINVDGGMTSYIGNTQRAVTITTKDYTPTISVLADSTAYTHFLIKLDSTGMATAANAQPARYVLQYADSGSTPVSHKGDTVGTVTFPQDSIRADSLIYPGHKLACRILTKFRDGAAGDTLVDTSATFYVTIPDLTPVAVITRNGDSLAIAVDTTDCGLAGAAFNKIVIRRNLSLGIVTSRWTRQDSTANADTTINYNDIRAGSLFSVSWIVACSLSQTEKFTDTSATYTYDIADPLIYSLPPINGMNGCFVINKTSNAHTTGYIPIPSDASQIKLRWKMSGYATPGFADSVRFFIGSLGYDGRIIIDTLIDKTVIDTSADSCKTWPIWGYGVNDSTFKAANPANKFSGYITLWDDITDSATAAYADSELNQYLIYWRIEWDKK